jgi:hypothetical protein
VTDVKIINTILKSQNILQLGEKVSFIKIIKKIFKKKRLDIVLVEKAKPNQMSAVLFIKLMGKKFLWIQNFTNPPVPGFYTKLLLNQADTIFVKSRKVASKLHSFGIDKPKIRILK